MYLTGTGSGTHGSGVVGLLNGLPASTSDTSYKSLLTGYSYSTPGALVINYNNANNAIWNSGSFGATAAGSEPSSSGKSWFVLVKLTTASSGNDTIQVEEFAPTSTIPTDPSTITWDATYSTPITGSWKHVAVQLEAGASVDDFRLGDSYEAATGLQQAASLGTPTLSTQAFKGNKTTISVSSNAPGTVRFYVDGKRIPSCLAQPTTGSGNSYSATCSWSPPVQGQHKISATLTPSSILFLSTSSQSLVTQVKKRTNTR
jgi:hypothetical protein